MTANPVDAMRIGEVFRYAFLATGAAVTLFVLVGWVLLRWADRRTKTTTAGRVVGIVGKMGSGKTYAAVRVASERLRSGVDVASNFTLDPAALGGSGRWAPFTSWADLEHIRDAVVVVDEAHLLAPSSHSMKFPMQAREALAFARKRGIDLYWISQSADRVNRTLRDLTTEMWHCRRVQFGGFAVERWEPEDYGRAKAKPFARRRYRLDPSIAAAYDTSQVVSMDDHLVQLDNRERAASRAAGNRARSAS